MPITARAIRGLALPIVVCLAVLAGCTNETEEPATGDTENPTATETGSSAPAPSGDCAYPASGQGPDGIEAPPSEPSADGDIDALIMTTAGDLGLTLHADDAPCTVNSFLSLVEQDYFDDTICHRLTTAEHGIFVLQCGDPTGTGTGGPGYTIPDEYDGSETYPAGTVAMARTPEPNSGGSQFFLVYEDTPLPPEYTVFGTLTEPATQLLQVIASAGIDPDQESPMGGPPAQRVTITGIDIA